MLGRSLFWVLGIMLMISSVSCTQKKNTSASEAEYTGSESCIQCHEKFYKLWKPSYHGQAMMPVNGEFINKNQLPNSSQSRLKAICLM